MLYYGPIRIFNDFCNKVLSIFYYKKQISYCIDDGTKPIESLSEY